MKKKGMTLVEVLVSSIILVISIAGVFSVYMNYLKMSADQRDLFNANQLLKEIHENASDMSRQEVFDDVINNTGLGTMIVSGTTFSASFTSATLGFKGLAGSPINIDSSSTATFLYVTSTISWDNNAKSISSNFVTY